MFFAARDRETVYSQQKQDGELTVAEIIELLIAKFRQKLKKVRKTMTPFRYDLNQIPYGYTVEVTNRFKGIDLIDRVPEELWTDVCDIVWEAVIKTITVRGIGITAELFQILKDDAVKVLHSICQKI